MKKDFDNWNNRKKEINFAKSVPTIYCKEGEIWWGALGVNIGVETDGKNENFERPLLILRRFNKHMVWVAPISTKTNHTHFYTPIDVDGQTQWVIVSQLRTISTRRLLRRIRTLSAKEFSVVFSSTLALFKNETPP